MYAWSEPSRPNMDLCLGVYSDPDFRVAPALRGRLHGGNVILAGGWVFSTQFILVEAPGIYFPFYASIRDCRYGYCHTIVDLAVVVNS